MTDRAPEVTEQELSLLEPLADEESAAWKYLSQPLCRASKILWVASAEGGSQAQMTIFVMERLLGESIGTMPAENVFWFGDEMKALRHFSLGMYSVQMADAIRIDRLFFE